MGDYSQIEWTEGTWNPWRGCTKVSPGCASCYMFTGQLRWRRDPTQVVRASDSTFNAPLSWTRRGFPRLVFTCSWSDWFHPEADGWRDEAWAVVRESPEIVFQILTKRPELIRDRLPADWGRGYPNVWLGVSVENPRFTWRLDILLSTPAAVHFVSAEPLLRPVDLRPWLRVREGLDWVIVGGESGGRPGHEPRQMLPDWVRQIRDACRATSTPLFFKQWGGRFPGGQALLDGREWREMPTGVRLTKEARVA